MFNFKSSTLAYMAIFMFFSSLALLLSRVEGRRCISAEIYIAAYERCDANTDCIIDAEATNKLIVAEKRFEGCKEQDD